MVKRTYKKILNVIGDNKMTAWVIIRRFEEIYGYKPNKSTMYSNLSRAVRDGILSRDENGFYSCTPRS